MLVGIIDIGSNTVRLTVYEVNEQTQELEIFFKLKTMAGLVSYIDPKTRLMSKAGIERLVGILNNYLASADKLTDIAGPFAFATAGIRNAKNADKVIKQVQKACGLHVDLIDGEEEARLGYAGVMRTSTLDTGVQIDVGGGSTEVALFRKRKITNATSIPHGSLSLFDECVRDFLPTPVEADRIRDIIRTGISTSKLPLDHLEKASGVGGTVRAARRLRDAWIERDTASKDTAPNMVSHAEIDAILQRVTYDPHTALRDILRIVPERSHTCIPGLVAVQTVMDTFGVNTLEVNNAGVREGYLLERVLENGNESVSASIEKSKD